MLRSARQAGSSLSLAALFLLSLQGYAQQAGDTKAPDTAATPKADEQVIQLSPFKVTTDKDKGYRATNTTSGTRLNTAIKELPIPIEVITDAFIKDTAATDLRQSLRYSAGIQLQTQTDWGASFSYGSTNPGGANNPEGSSANPNQSVVKIRGYTTEATLRDGFRRQNSTDAVNLARVEVIRGPNALLYGVGNFGGVVNYLVKQPENKAGGSYSLEIGSYNFKRATLDYTGPISDTVSYRLTGAFQDTKNNTDFYKENHFFVSPVITWKPFAGTEITIDTEYGKQNQAGIGFQDLRAVPTGYPNHVDAYGADFYQIPGKNIKNVRWSGPDTYNKSEAANFLVKLDQKITDDLHLNVGVDRSTFRYDQRDVAASFASVSSNTPAWAIGTITYRGLVPTQAGIPTGPQPSTIIYQWGLSTESDKHDQIRADLNYNHTIFESNKWLKVENTFLGGVNYTNETHEYILRGTAYDRDNYKNPNDYSPFRFGIQPNGSADYPMYDNRHIKDITQDAATYAVYQGKLLDGWVTLIAGIRKDRSWNKDWHYNPQWGESVNSNGVHRQNQGSDSKPVAQYGAPSKDTTHQYGIDLKLIRDGSLSLYAMSAEASEPNYSGVKDFSGNLLQSSLGKDKEIGLKFDLFNGRVSGTVSKFQITRTRVGIGNAGGIWWAPTNAANLTFNPNKNIVYQINDLNPANNGWNSAVVASTAQWNAAVAAGTIYQATNSSGATNWYVNASSTTGAALMDAVFANAVSTHSTGWWGWIYSFDNLTNEATTDYNGQSPPGPTGGQSVPLGSDRASGWDAQILLSPTDNLQIALSYSHITKVVLNSSAWIKYPYPQDRWAIWYAPIDWADGGSPASARYTNPADTSTHISFGNGLPLDDTPKDEFNAWLNYQISKDSSLHGLVFGIGLNHEGEGTIYPTYFSQKRDANGNVITLNSKSKTLYNAMARYEFKVHGHDASVQLNIENLANNTDYYGLIPNSPRKWYLTYSQKL
jgi:outer membrane receptor protein involved in Fe transport